MNHTLGRGITWGFGEGVQLKKQSVNYLMKKKGEISKSRKLAKSTIVVVQFTNGSKLLSFSHPKIFPKSASPTKISGNATDLGPMITLVICSS